MRAPEYYLLCTNVKLSPVSRKGAKDLALDLLGKARARTKLRDFDIWDYDKLRGYLDHAPEITRTYAAWISPGDVLTDVIKSLNCRPNFGEVMGNFPQKELLADQFVNLKQAGRVSDREAQIARVFVDLPFGDSPDEEEDPNSPSPGFVRQLLEIGNEPLREDEVITQLPLPVPPNAYRRCLRVAKGSLQGSLGHRLPGESFWSVALELVIPRQGDTEFIEPTRDGALTSEMLNDNSPAFLVVGYGATRRVEESATTSPSEQRRSRALRYQRVAGLFEPQISLIPLHAWLPRMRLKNRGRHNQVVHLTFEGIFPLPKAESGHDFRRARVTIDFFDLAAREELLRERAELIKAVDIAVSDLSNPSKARRRSAEQTIKFIENPKMPHRNCVRAYYLLCTTDLPAAEVHFDRALDYLDTLGA